MAITWITSQLVAGSDSADQQSLIPKYRFACTMTGRDKNMNLWQLFYHSLQCTPPPKALTHRFAYPLVLSQGWNNSKLFIWFRIVLKNNKYAIYTFYLA